jgi:hypothetical protein
MATTKSLLIQFGDGGSPEVFAHNCSINTTREFTIEATTNDGTAPDCNDLDAPSWVLRSIDTLSAGITGAGTMDPLSFAVMRDKMLGGYAIKARIKIDIALAAGGGYYAGSFVVTNLSIQKEGKGYLTCNISLASDGAITWVPAAV